jgi:hypothetical protein
MFWALALLAPLAALPAPRAHAQPATPADALAASAREGRAPDADQTLRAFRTLRRYVDQWGLPPRPEPGELPSVAGAAVQIRYEGQLIGRGSDVVSEVTAAADRDDPRARVLWRAMMQAFSEADRRVPVKRDLLRDDRLAEAGRRAVLSVELAGALTPIDPQSFDDFDVLIRPGLDGLAVKGAAGVFAAFPSTMFASNAVPSTAARSLVAQALGEPAAALEDWAKLKPRGKLSVFKFRVTHAAQTGPGAQPTLLYRGDTPVGLLGLDQAGLRSMAASMAQAIQSRTRRADSGGLRLLGLFQSWKGVFRDEQAGVHEAALAALALRRYSALPGLDAKAASAAADTANRLMLELAEGPAGAGADAEPASAAVVVLAVAERRALASPGPASQAELELYRRCAARLDRAFDRSRGFEAELPPPARGPVAAALAAVADLNARGETVVDDIDRPLALQAVRRALADAPPAALVAQMPLLGLAELRLAKKGEIPSAVALRQMRAQLWAHQIMPGSTADGQDDLVGGVVFADGSSLPAWQCLRPLAFAATMLGDERLTTAQEVQGEVARLILAARFLRQLQARGGESWSAPRPDLAEGGIRAAPWDHNHPPDATSIGLLMISELLDALNRRAAPPTTTTAAPAQPSQPAPPAAPSEPRPG